MPVPTEASIQTQWKQVVEVYEEARKFAETNAKNFVGLYDAVIAGLDTDYAPEVAERLLSSRASLDALLREAGAALEPVFQTYAQVIDVPETDAQSVLTRLKDHFETNNWRLSTRYFTFGTPAASGAPVGGGTILRLNVDEDDRALENQHADDKVAECIEDASSGTERHEENFEFRGDAASRDSLRLAGSGARTEIAALSARASSPWVRNPSFSESVPAGVTAVPTEITDWTSNVAVSGTNYETVGGTAGVEGTDYYRAFPGDTTPLALRCKANAFILSQNLEANRVQPFSPGVPYFMQVALRRVNNADGTFTLTFGNVTKQLAINTVGNGAWTTVRIDVGKNSWFKNFNVKDLSVKLERSAGTTGQIDLDDLVVSPYAPFDGAWYVVIGNPTPFRRRDKFTWTDTEVSTVGILQRWLWRAFGRSLPATPNAPGAALTGALAGLGAGNVDNGVHGYKYAFVSSSAGEGPLSANANVTVADKTVNGQVSLSVIAAGPAGTSSRKVYRTTAGGAIYKLLTTINDNVTTTYTDNTADAGLGANAPTLTQITDPS